MESNNHEKPIEFTKSNDLKEAMEKAEVIDQPAIYYVDESK
jgi:hypothetical protein